MRLVTETNYLLESLQEGIFRLFLFLLIASTKGALLIICLLKRLILADFMLWITLHVRGTVLMKPISCFTYVWIFINRVEGRLRTAYLLKLRISIIHLLDLIVWLMLHLLIVY